MSTDANCICCSRNKTHFLNALTLHVLPPFLLPQASPLLRLRLRVTRLLQRSETLGFDFLALLLLFGAHNMGLLERGLNDAANESVIGRASDSEMIAKVILAGKARDNLPVWLVPFSGAS